MLPIKDCQKIQVAHCKFLCHCLAPFFSCYSQLQKECTVWENCFLKLRVYNMIKYTIAQTKTANFCHQGQCRNV
jgi:hypothetical protein